MSIEDMQDIVKVMVEPTAAMKGREKGDRRQYTCMKSTMSERSSILTEKSMQSTQREQ